MGMGTKWESKMGVGNATYSTLVQYDSVISVRASRVGGNDGARMMRMRMMRTTTTNAGYGDDHKDNQQKKEEQDGGKGYSPYLDGS